MNPLKAIPGTSALKVGCVFAIVGLIATQLVAAAHDGGDHDAHDLHNCGVCVIAAAVDDDAMGGDPCAAAPLQTFFVQAVPIGQSIATNGRPTRLSNRGPPNA